MYLLKCTKYNPSIMCNTVKVDSLSLSVVGVFIYSVVKVMVFKQGFVYLYG
jgi:hypothetical protein